MVNGTREKVNEKDMCCRLCSPEVDAETEFGVQDIYGERTGEESRIALREGSSCDSGLGLGFSQPGEELCCLLGSVAGGGLPWERCTSR